MKHHIFFVFIQVVLTIRSGLSINLNLLTSSSIGPYKLDVKSIHNCNPKNKTKIQHNMFASLKDNKTMFYGNSTLEIPIDDTLFLEIKLAEKDSFGRWKENTYMHKSPNACSSMKTLMGNSWTAFLNGVGVQNTNCPLLPGIYIAPGLDVVPIIKESNIPKIFTYGTYKLNIYYTKKNEMFGCQAMVLETKRP